MFPAISHINDLLPHIQANERIRVKEEHDGLTVVCYMVQDEDTFTGTAELYERECRGITFYPDGRVASRPLHKFFNVGERADAQPDTIRWSDVARVMEKRDGSMITPVMMPDGSLKCKTKKTFNSAEASCADAIISRTNGGASWIRQLLATGITPTFEITSPRFQIVVRYDADELTLLHARENHSGRYLRDNELSVLGSPFPVAQNIIREFEDGHGGLSWDKLRAYHETTEGVEGVVLQFSSGEMLKLKTKWYIDLHRSVTFTRWRDIARTIIDDKADDLKAAFSMIGRSIAPIVEVERKINELISSVSLEVMRAVDEDGALTVKDFALKHKADEHFSLLMRARRGQEIDWREWYSKNHVDSWSLEQVD